MVISYIQSTSAHKVLNFRSAKLRHKLEHNEKIVLTIKFDFFEQILFLMTISVTYVKYFIDYEDVLFPTLIKFRLKNLPVCK